MSKITSSILAALLLAPLAALQAAESKLPALAVVAPISITDLRTAAAGS